MLVNGSVTGDDGCVTGEESDHIDSGFGWFAHTRDGSRERYDAPSGEPRVNPAKPSIAEPLHIRMMTDDVSEIALWDESVSSDYLEAELPIPHSLSARIREWVDEYTATIGGINAHWTMDDLHEHDRRGYHLSLELQSALGAEYRIEYVFETKELEETVRRSKQDEG